MSDQITIAGKEYISSKRASELSGYTQDYVGQIARKGAIDARRMGGLWYVSLASLQDYKNHAETYKPTLPARTQAIDPDSLIAFDGKDYISAPRAAKTTGYHQDYVGQLARSGAILSRQVGNRWYVQREAIVAHKAEKDALLGAVQAESVGLKSEDSQVQKTREATFFTYTREDGALIPTIEKSHEVAADGLWEAEETNIPIHIKWPKIASIQPSRLPARILEKKERKYDPRYAVFAAAFTIVIVLTFGFATLKERSVYAIKAPAVQNGSMLVGAAAQAFEKLGDLVERWVAPRTDYMRPQ